MFALDHSHMAIPPNGEEAARRFWCAGLGLSEKPKPAALAKRGGLWLRLAGAELHLGAERQFAPAREAHVALRVDDIDAVARKLDTMGHEVRWDHALADRRRFYTDDPFEIDSNFFR